VLKKLDESGATLNPEKYEFSKKEVKQIPWNVQPTGEIY
jgi:hypothetical protein